MTISYRPKVNLGRIRAPLTLVGALHFIAGAAEAQQEILSEAQWLTEIPKVVYATRQEQSVTSAPSSVTVINREMIDALGAVNVAEILRLVPGFQMFYSNGSTYGVTPHGISNRYPKRLEVRVNGRSVHLPQLASVAWESLGILPDDIDHIEVVRGSNVPSYGSKAIMGAVNIVTRNAVQQEGGSVRATYGSAGTEVINMTQHLALEHTDIQVRAAHKESNGFQGVDDDGRTAHLVFSSVYTPNLVNTLELEAGVSRGKINTGDGDHLDEFVEDSRHSAWISGNWQHQSGDQLWKLNFSYTDYHFETSDPQYLSDLIGVPATVIPLIPFWSEPHQDERIDISQGDRHFYMADVELEHHLNRDQWRVVWGLGSRQSQLMSENLLGGTVDDSVHYGFSNVEWTPSEQLVFNLGFMLEDKEGKDFEISPRVAVNYHLSGSQHLRLSGTRAYRQPSLLESSREEAGHFANGDLIDLINVSADDVDPARVDTIELGYIGYWDDGDLGLDVKLFQETVRDEIDSFDIRHDVCTSTSQDIEAMFLSDFIAAGRSPQEAGLLAAQVTPDAVALSEKYCTDFTVDGQFGAFLNDRVRVLDNVAEWEVQGLEAQFTWKISRHSWLRLDYAYLEAEGQRERRNFRYPFTKGVANQVPEHSAGILFGHEFASGYQLSGYWKFVDYIDWRSGTNVKSHGRLDLKVGKRWQTERGDIEAALTVQNALDKEYLEFQNNNEFHRRAFMSLTYHWPQ